MGELNLPDKGKIFCDAIFPTFIYICQRQLFESLEISVLMPIKADLLELDH